MNKYEDMLDMKRPVSKKHPPMPIKDRAAQFAPFAALSFIYHDNKAILLFFNQFIFFQQFFNIRILDKLQQPAL